MCKSMYIDLDKRVAFVHIPKTGGVAVHHYMSQSCSNGIALWNTTSEMDWAHPTLEHVRLPPDFKSFCVVRDPIDRCYSAFLYVNQLNDSEESRETFTIFVKSGELKLTLEKASHATPHFLPQATWLECVTHILPYQNPLRIPSHIFQQSEDIVITEQHNTSERSDKQDPSSWIAEDVCEEILKLYEADQDIWLRAKEHIILPRPPSPPPRPPSPPAPYPTRVLTLLQERILKQRNTMHQSMPNEKAISNI